MPLCISHYMKHWILLKIENEILAVSFSFCVSVTPLSPTHCSCSGLLWHPFTVGDIHATLGRATLDEGSARRTDLYLTRQHLAGDTHPCPRWDWNPQPQHASGRRRPPQTKQPPGSAFCSFGLLICKNLAEWTYGILAETNEQSDTEMEPFAEICRVWWQISVFSVVDCSSE